MPAAVSDQYLVSSKVNKTELAMVLGVSGVAGSIAAVRIVISRTETEIITLANTSRFVPKWIN